MRRCPLSSSIIHCCQSLSITPSMGIVAVASSGYQPSPLSIYRLTIARASKTGLKAELRAWQSNTRNKWRQHLTVVMVIRPVHDGLDRIIERGPSGLIFFHNIPELSGIGNAIQHLLNDAIRLFKHD